MHQLYLVVNLHVKPVLVTLLLAEIILQSIHRRTRTTIQKRKSMFRSASQEDTTTKHF